MREKKEWFSKKEKELKTAERKMLTKIRKGTKIKRQC